MAIRSGMKALIQGLIWRISADLYPFGLWGLQCAPTQGNVVPVAGPSNTKLAANCQNRYPSPFKRSDQFLVRPLNPSGDWQGLASLGVHSKKTFAFQPGTGASGGINLSEKGDRPCKRKSGSRRLLPFCRYQLAVILRWNRGLWARGPVQPRRLFLAGIRQRVQCWAGPGMSCIASKTQAHVVDRLIRNTTKSRIQQGHWDPVPVAFLRGEFDLKLCGDIRCSTKS